MSNLFLKNFNLCFPKHKWTTNKPNDRSPRSTTQSTSSILIKSFNSLYDVTSDSTADDLFTSSDDSFSSADSPPDFASVFASQRFFFSSPGLSNSIIDSLPESDPLIGGGVAVPTYSPDPFTDFRRSMQEMVDSRDLIDVTEDWDYLHELLRCYLSLNPKHTHKFILGAFADLLVCLMSSAAGGHRRRRRSVSRRVL